MERAKVDWQMIYYSGAVHSFTDPEANDHGMQGLAYDAKADQRSWQHMKIFFDEIFGE